VAQGRFPAAGRNRPPTGCAVVTSDRHAGRLTHRPGRGRPDRATAASGLGEGRCAGERPVGAVKSRTMGVDESAPAPREPPTGPAGRSWHGDFPDRQHILAGHATRGQGRARLGALHPGGAAGRPRLFMFYYREPTDARPAMTPRDHGSRLSRLAPPGRAVRQRTGADISNCRRGSRWPTSSRRRSRRASRPGGGPGRWPGRTSVTSEARSSGSAEGLARLDEGS